MENISTAVHGQCWISHEICMSLWSSWPVVQKALKWWWWSGIDGLQGCNILIADLIDYDDNVMAEHIMNIENFCVHSEFHSQDSVTVLQLCPNEANKSKAFLHVPAQSWNMYFLWLTSYKHFHCNKPFSFGVYCIMFCSFYFDVSV